MDFVQARNNMVDCQVRPSDVTDLRLLAAMLELPRERFVPPAQADLAYSDFAVPLGPASPDLPARRLMRPRDIAKLIQAAEVEPDDIALVVGCASGYGAALLSRLVSQVVALEQDSGLAAFAGEALRKCGIHTVSIAAGPLNAGWPARAPYDVIVVEGAIEALPSALPNQLTDGGRLVCVEGRGLARAMLYRSETGVVSGRSVFDAAAPLLPGFSVPAAFIF